MTETTINQANVRDECKRLNELGLVRITYESGVARFPPSKRNNPVTGRVVGFAIDNQERDCVLILGPYGMLKRNTVRSVVAAHITKVEVLDTFGRRSGFFLDAGGPSMN